ncbi:hypothetical protein L546_0435 [Bordetella pertussis H897]|nr:hypothetical protein L546_0435 [Bordetella pertussis H897]
MAPGLSGACSALASAAWVASLSGAPSGPRRAGNGLGHQGRRQRDLQPGWAGVFVFIG